MTTRKPQVYIDTRGVSWDHHQNAPEGVRVAYHLADGNIIEMEANPDGTWHVYHGRLQTGGYTTLASGRLAEHADREAA